MSLLDIRTVENIIWLYTEGLQDITKMNNLFKNLNSFIYIGLLNDVCKLVKTIRLLRIHMKRRRNTLNKLKKLNKNPNWLWKREIRYNG